MREVITIICIPHHHVFPLSGKDSTTQSASIPFFFDVDHAGTAVPGDALGTVRAAVVRNNDLSPNVGDSHSFSGFVNTNCQRLSFIQARHYYR